MRTLWPPPPGEKRPNGASDQLPETQVDDPDDAPPPVADCATQTHTQPTPTPPAPPLPYLSGVTSVDRALGLVANRWERERRRHLQEVARRDTILRQRKMSAVIKVRNKELAVVVAATAAPSCCSFHVQKVSMCV